MRFDDAFSQIQDAITVRRFFGEPDTHDGVTVIPVAAVAAGAGGGSGSDATQGGEGEGGGLVVSGRPVGAYVISDGRVTWEPAFDLNRAIAWGSGVAITLLLVIARMQRRRMAPRRRAARQ